MTSSNSPSSLSHAGVDFRRAFMIGAFLVSIVAAGWFEFTMLREDELTDKRDIRALYDDGARILAHQNPYARTLEGDMRVNQQYSTYFPLFYLLSAGSQVVFKGYPQFISFWRWAMFPFYVGVGLALAYPSYAARRVAPAVLVLLLWLFNRWTLKSAELMHIDFMAILPLVVSLLLFDRRRRASLLLLGVSLSVKQIAVFVVPLYLIWTWNDAAPGRRLRDALVSGITIAAIPLLLSLPFIAIGPSAFVKSMLFSATRSAEAKAYMGAPSFDEVLNLGGLKARAPMVGLLGLTYFAAWRRQMPRSVAALLVIGIFVCFNTILFRQYLNWVIAMVPVVMGEMLPWPEQKPHQGSLRV